MKKFVSLMEIPRIQCVKRFTTYKRKTLWIKLECNQNTPKSPRLETSGSLSLDVKFAVSPKISSSSSFSNETLLWLLVIVKFEGLMNNEDK